MTQVTKLHRLRCAAYNLGLVLRKVYGMSKLRSAKAGWAAFFGILALLWLVIATVAEPMIADFVTHTVFGILLIVVSAACWRKFPGARTWELGVL